ncbi:hypothetical protein FLBR109950_05950 [Flavobacterium branchiophilum]
MLGKMVALFFKLFFYIDNGIQNYIIYKIIGINGNYYVVNHEICCL